MNTYLITKCHWTSVFTDDEPCLIEDITVEAESEEDAVNVAERHTGFALEDYAEIVRVA